MNLLVGVDSLPGAIAGQGIELPALPALVKGAGEKVRRDLYHGDRDYKLL